MTFNFVEIVFLFFKKHSSICESLHLKRFLGAFYPLISLKSGTMISSCLMWDFKLQHAPYRISCRKHVKTICGEAWKKSLGQVNPGIWCDTILWVFILKLKVIGFMWILAPQKY